MTNTETRFHEEWLGLVQPTEGLVVSLPVLVEAQCMRRNPPAVQQKLLELSATVETDDETNDAVSPTLTIPDLDGFLEELLDLSADLFDRNEDLPDDLSLYVPEGRQTLRPSLALRRLEGAAEANVARPDDRESILDRNGETPASRAGAGYLLLLWDLPDGLDLDKPETATGPWEYPPAAKFDRLLRYCRVPIGVLTNRRQIRLVYAPHGESSGSITFRLDDMASTGGRPILDALLMLLSAHRFFGAAPEHQIPSLLAESRKRQADVTNELADQVFEALAILLRGFEAAAERDGRARLDEAHRAGDDHLYGGLLTVLLRLVFVLYAEDRGLLPVEHSLYARHLSLLDLFDQLQSDYGAYPDSMSRRFGAWGRLLSLFRALYLGVEHGDLHLPARRGQLFDPNEYPFLEGASLGGSVAITLAEKRAEVRVPSVDDETVYRALEKLIVFQGQRLSYRALDVEQIGSVYEALMGYHVVRVLSPTVCLGPNRYWVQASELLDVTPSRRAKWLEQQTGLAKKKAKDVVDAITALSDPQDEAAVATALEDFRVRGTERIAPDHLVLQPGAERRRTSSHYTPRSLSAPIVRKTLEPLLRTMGDAPSSDQLLSLKVCDPAMGSGAFLVEACRFLADQLVAAWTREEKLELVASAHEDVTNHARRLVAQRCLYGVDKNRFAVDLAKLSLWLVTLAKDLPFTFLDHTLRHGDALVGLDLDQLRAFHWKPKKQMELSAGELASALDEAVALRQQIGALDDDGSAEMQREKERLLFDANDALARVRLLGDLVVGAFFSSTKGKERETERNRRFDLVTRWLGGESELRDELEGMREEIRGGSPSFTG